MSKFGKPYKKWYCPTKIDPQTWCSHVEWENLQAPHQAPKQSGDLMILDEIKNIYRMLEDIKKLIISTSVK